MPISLFHWNQISFLWAFFWGLKTASSRWGPDLENWKQFEVKFMSFCNRCDRLVKRCIVLVKELIFVLLHFRPGFFFFLQVHQWYSTIFGIDDSFFSQGNQWTKYLAHPKKRKPKPCLLMFVSLVTLDGFHLPLSTQLTADLTPEWNNRSLFHPFSHINAKTPFCCVESVANNAVNRRHVDKALLSDGKNIVQAKQWLNKCYSDSAPSETMVKRWYDRLWANAAPTLNISFSLTNVHAKWWIHCLLISSTPLLSHPTSIYSRPKRVLWSFLFSRRTANLWTNNPNGLKFWHVPIWRLVLYKNHMDFFY